MSKKYFRIVSLFLVAVFLMTSGFGCKLQDEKTKEKMKEITLNYWRVWDDEDAFSDIIKDYEVTHPNIKINYRKFRNEEYESELLNAFAEDRGPDIFSIPQSWLRNYQAKIEPMPTQLTMAYSQLEGTIKKEQVVTLKTSPTPSLRQLKDLFADTVADDVVLRQQVYGLPLSLESLIMFYNKDILNQAGISQVPADWKSFQDASAKITKIDKDNNIILSGAAMGTGANVENSFDILSLLMMQNGATMATPLGLPTFFTSLKGAKQSEGETALQFYTDFASPLKSVYSWNGSMASSAFETFLSGKAGFTFDYNFQIPTIRASAPKLNFGIAPAPQIPGNPTVNYANYWVETVSKKSKYIDESWDFLLFATTKDAEAKKFLDKTKRPTALKKLIDKQMEDEDLHASVAQTLTAKTWYKGKDPKVAENAFQEMIDRYLVTTDDQQIHDILNIALQKIAQTVDPDQNSPEPLPVVKTK